MGWKPSLFGIHVALSASAVALVGALVMIFHLNHFVEDGAVLWDAGIAAHLFYQADLRMLNPPSIGAIYPSNYSTHVSPFFAIVGWLLRRLSSDFSIVAAMGHTVAFVGLALFGVLAQPFALAPPLASRRALLRRTACLLIALGLPFSAIGMRLMIYPHHEIMLPALAALFFLALFSRCFAIAVPLGLFIPLLKEDAGFHLFGFLFLAIVFRYWCAGWSRDLQTWMWLAAYALAGSLAALAFRATFYPIDDLFFKFYVGPVPFAHVTWDSISHRLAIIYQRNFDVMMLALPALACAIACRDAGYTLGLLGCLPWFVFNLFAYIDHAWTLSSHHTYVFLMAAIWPVVWWRLRDSDAQSLVPAVRERRATFVVVICAASLVASTILYRAEHGPTFTATFDSATRLSTARVTPTNVLRSFTAALAREGRQISADYPVTSVAPEFIAAGAVLERDTSPIAGNLFAFHGHSWQSHESLVFAASMHDPLVLRIDDSPFYVAFARPLGHHERDLRHLEAAAMTGKLALVPTTIGSIRASALRRGKVGSKPCRRCLVRSSGTKGSVAFSSGHSLPAGRYSIGYKLSWLGGRSDANGDVRFTVEDARSAKEIASRIIQRLPTGEAEQEIDLEFMIDEHTAKSNRLRIFSLSGQIFEIRELNIRKN